MSHVTPAPTRTLRKHAPVLITENQVAFCTAAAPVESKRRRWLDTTLMGGLGRIITGLTQPHHSRRDLAYLEAARMSRAMDRL
jgi:hypothetical protein